MNIEIPFHKRFLIPMLSGSKIATTRSRRYGRIGDYFHLQNCEGTDSAVRFKIISVSRERLGDIAAHLYREEGFKNPEEFKNFWLTMHRKWEPEKKYCLHVFQRDHSIFKDGGLVNE